MINAYLIIRTALGLNIFLHGFVRLAGNYNSFVDSVSKEFKETMLNNSVVKIFAQMLPFLELVIGIFLMLGLFTQIGIVSGFIVMLVLLSGKAIKQDWLTVSLQMIYILFYALLEAFIQFNKIAIDIFFNL